MSTNRYKLSSNMKLKLKTFDPEDTGDFEDKEEVSRGIREPSGKAR